MTDTILINDYDDPMFKCSNEGCAVEWYPAGVLALLPHNDDLICKECWQAEWDGNYFHEKGDCVVWSDLKPFVPDYQNEIDRLRELERELATIKAQAEDATEYALAFMLKDERAAKAELFDALQEMLNWRDINCTRPFDKIKVVENIARPIWEKHQPEQKQVGKRSSN